MKLLITGHILLIICCIFYLSWWCCSFYPGFEGSKVSGLPGLLLLITAIAGLSGTGLSIAGIHQPGIRPEILPSGIIIIGGVFLYLLLLACSSIFMHRPVTTELVLIIGWFVLECLSYQTLYCQDRIAVSQMVFLLILAFAATICSVFFYLQYYQVSATTGFIYGMIPLITEAMCMLAAVLIVCFRNR